jgi:hypothetical protein
MTSTIKVNTIQDSCGSALVSKCSSTITLGASGKTVALATGASQTGFGRTGTVDWQTTPKTATFTAVSGEGYFCNTAGGSFEVDLPAGSAGAIVSIQDYNNTFDTNNLTIDPNGSEKINGGDAGIAATLSTEGQGITLVYIDSTVGWRSIHSDDFAQVPQTPAYITATGGNTVSNSSCGNYKIHVFTGPGTFTVCSVGNQAGSNSVDYLVVAGGGGTPGMHYGNTPSGGGGAGGFRASAANFTVGCQPAKPLVCGVSAVTVSATGYPVVVGAGGSGGSSGPGNAGSAGSTSSALSISSAGGGRGGHSPANTAGDGGSGGGEMGPGRSAGSGNTPPVSPPQGNDGGVGVTGPGNSSPGTDNTGTGGGGGAIQTGFNGGTGTPNGGGGDGGDGAGFASGTWGSTGEVVSCVQYYAGGGGGGVYTPNPSPNPGGIGGLGGGGNGGSPANPSSITSPGREGQTGTANTGGGGGSNGGAPSPTSNFSGMAGGSGIVVIRYKFQN